jgi:hypothetical protein
LAKEKIFDGLQIPSRIRRELPNHILEELNVLPHGLQVTFSINYQRKRCSRFKCLLLSIAPILILMYPIHFRYLGMNNLIHRFWISIGGVGLWYLFEIFFAPLVRVPEKNLQLAKALVYRLQTEGTF